LLRQLPDTEARAPVRVTLPEKKKTATVRRSLMVLDLIQCSIFHLLDQDDESSGVASMIILMEKFLSDR